METTAGSKAPTALQALPPIADLISREVRRMGRAWKIESVKAALYVVVTMVATSVVGIGWSIVLIVVAVFGWTFWSKFTLKATVKPYK